MGGGYTAFTGGISDRLDSGGTFKLVVNTTSTGAWECVELTQPTVATTLIYDPWWGYYGSALVPANQVIGSYSPECWCMGRG